MKRLAVAVAILSLEFVALEAAIRWHGGTDAAPGFQSLFMRDPEVGHRLQPGARTRYTTVEFSTDLRINAQGVRDDEDIGPKPANERRVVVLGDSLVMSVQVPFVETFTERLEANLNAPGSNVRWRVINAGVQGHGPVQEWFFFDRVVAAFEPDLVLIVVFVGNDAIEAFDLRQWLEAGRPVQPPTRAVGVIREIVRSSVVLQLARLRWDLLRAQLTTDTPERPLESYLADPPPHVLEGVAVTRTAVERIAGRAGRLGARTGIVLMPARFQTDDDDYGRLAKTVAEHGGTLERHAATERFRAGLAATKLPMLDLLPVLQTQPNRIGLFFQRNVHLTPRGHELVGRTLAEFVRSAGLADAAR